MNISRIRHVTTPIVAGVVTTAMVSVVALGAPAQAAQVASGDLSTSAAATLAQQPVLESDFGEARSRVHGTFGRNGTVTGTFTPRRFENSGGRLWAVGRLDATLTRGNGEVVGDDTKFGVRLPVRRAEGEPVGRLVAQQPEPGDCQILNLVLGPLDLNLLGLKVHLNRVVLNIFATPGPGNLLGNLLCAIAGLLDEGGLLTEVRRILNAVLAILRL
jgi:hypothetical protein